MDTRRQPGFLWGALVGLIITPPLMALLFIGQSLANLPFLPFEVFDWVGRTLPGGLVTFGIDTIVNTLIRFGFGSDLDTAAKASEQILAILIFWTICIVASALFFEIMNRIRRPQRDMAPGLVAGLILGLPLIVMSSAVSLSLTSPMVRFIWFVLAFIGWGIALNYAYESLRGLPADAKVDLPATVQPIDRRSFLITLGGSAAALTVVGAGLAEFLKTDAPLDTPVATTQALPAGAAPVALKDGEGNALPNASDPLQPAPGTRLEYTPVADHYRIDILSSSLPQFDEVTFKLPITGLVANEVAWSMDEIRAMPSRDDFITMSCISNRVGGSLISTTKWTGVPMQHILDQIQPGASARALKITGADSFDEYVDLDLIRQDERIMLAYAFDDKPLPQRNGYPLRIHIPNHYGMKQPKWISKIEVVDELGEGYWVRRGWSRDAIVNATSVVDTVAANAIYEKDGAKFVPVGGIAWAGARGIKEVQVRVDGGDWQTAALRSPMSDRTWNIWRYDWPYSEGQHSFEVRCVETDGTPQIESIADVRPDGATGIHGVSERV
jgi:DMSO/TMAO reductase YedYZ molybdopterin-dependent catalytic subunit